jgi:hypothetical protein
MTSFSGPTQLLTVIALVSLPAVMFGGYSLLGLLGKGKLSESQRVFFRAGHAHAGVLLVLTLGALQLLAQGGLGQSGGLFLHLLPGRSPAHGVTVGGATLLAAAMLMTAYGVAVG